MSEWWTYRPSDFLLFAPRTYYRLVELYNLELWPAQLVAIAGALLLVALAWRGARHARRVAATVLALAWAFVGWRFHWHHYATINWAAAYFAAACALQALLLAWAATRAELDEGAASPARRRAGLALVVAALAVLPLVALALGRPWTQIEVAGLSPDPTALLTLGVLLMVRQAHWTLFVVPALWCLVSALTLWTMDAPEAAIMLLGALSIGVARQRSSHSPTH
jgi:hypothetical protein